jgi:hypothetical protein
MRECSRIALGFNNDCIDVLIIYKSLYDLTEVACAPGTQHANLLVRFTPLTPLTPLTQPFNSIRVNKV